MKQEKSWEITDDFWEAAPVLIPEKQRDPEKEYKRKPGGGRSPLESRKVLEAIFFVLRTGIQWKAPPRSFGAASAVHRYFMFWCRQGFFKALRVSGLTRYYEAAGIDRSRLGADGCMTKAPLAQENVGRNPADRGKKREQAPFVGRRQRGSPCVSDNRR
jgi:transposase